MTAAIAASPARLLAALATLVEGEECYFGGEESLCDVVGCIRCEMQRAREELARRLIAASLASPGTPDAFQAELDDHLNAHAAFDEHVLKCAACSGELLCPTGEALDLASASHRSPDVVTVIAGWRRDRLELERLRSRGERS